MTMELQTPYTKFKVNTQSINKLNTYINVCTMYIAHVCVYKGANQRYFDREKGYM